MSFDSKQVLATLGALSLLIALYKVASFVLLYTRPSRFWRYQPKNGETAWTLVTGSSDGIGKAFAKEFASKGFNVIIHGRNAEKLDALQRELEAAFPRRKFRKLVLDASDPSALFDPNALSEISDCLPLKVLVNNVGSLPPGNQLGSLEEISAEHLSTNVAVNAVFPLLFTKAVYPMLKASQPSLVLSIGSFADIGMPVFPAYAASKSFLMTSSTELGLEAKVAGTDIEFLGLRIMQVTGTQVVQLPTSFMVPDTETWVKLSLARVGCGRRSVVPHWPQGVHDVLWKTLPWWMIQKLLITISKGIQADNMGRSGADAEKKDL